MKPTMEILARIKQNSERNKDEIFTRLYRYLLRPDIYYVAYSHLYANNGAATKGIVNDTADGFSERKVTKIIQSLTDETYQPAPVRRTYIEKKNGKKRPLGIPTFTDKLVQEAVRMVLESVYEPIFLNCSHGFRPNRSCHTALKDISRGFNGIRWFVEGDIKGCFDNIDHTVLISFIRKKVKDARLIKLIYQFLKAGYMEDWQYHVTYSGTPQGGILSPLLANIYLHRLDHFVMELKADFDKPGKSTPTREYCYLNTKRWRLHKRIDAAKGEERQRLIEEYKQLGAQKLKTPAKSQTDKKLKYVRYADDFLIGVNGSHEDCVEIKRRLTEFIGNTLKMELSNEKTLITHSNQYARFLGYDVRVRRDGTVRRRKDHVLQRVFNNTVELNVPLNDKICQFLFSKGIVRQGKDGTLYPYTLESLTDLEILTVYNAELRGICNYYSMASNFSKLDYFAYLMEYNCLKTLAGKHKTTTSKIRTMYKDGQGKWAIPYQTKDGQKRCYFAKFRDCKASSNPTDCMKSPAVIFANCQRHFKMSFFAEMECQFLQGSIQVLYSLIHHITCRLEARQALIYQLVSGLMGENGKYNYSKAVHLYPPFFDIFCSPKNYKTASALTATTATASTPGSPPPW